MKAISTLNMSHDEWLATRKESIGSSDMAALLGLNKYVSPYELYLDKTAEFVLPQEATEKMEAGTFMEPAIAALFAHRYPQYKVVQDHKIRYHADYDFISCNLDRVLQGDNDGKGTGLLEIKNMGQYYFNYCQQYGWPTYFYAQVQEQFAVTGWKWGLIVVLVDGWKLELIPLEPDPEFIAGMIEKACDFWHNNVEKRIAPPVTCMRDIKELYPEDIPDSSMEADAELIRFLGDIVKAKEDQKAAAAKEEEISVKVKDIMGRTQVITSGKLVLTTFKNDKPKEYIDEQLLRAIDQGLWDRHTRKFTVTKEVEEPNIPAMLAERPELKETVVKKKIGSRKFLMKPKPIAQAMEELDKQLKELATSKAPELPESGKNKYDVVLSGQGDLFTNNVESVQ